MASLYKAHSRMNKITPDNEEIDPLPEPTSQQAAIGEVEEDLRHVSIHPVNLLESFENLRIDKARVKPIEGSGLKAGLKSNTELVVLLPKLSTSSTEFEDGEYVAVKKLKSKGNSDSDRAFAPLAHELGILKDLSQKHVVKTIGFIEDIEQGVAWMIFSWEKNGNLREFVRSAPWVLAERVSLINDVANGLNHLHGRSPPICHGDMKSLNILVNSENHAIITDLSAARTVNSMTLTGLGIIWPTEELRAVVDPYGEFITLTCPAWAVRWAAPEVLRGQLPGLASDVWPLGWICWEVLTGDFLITEGDNAATGTRVITEDLSTTIVDEKRSRIQALCTLMEDCWKPWAGQRRSAKAFLEAVDPMDRTIPHRRDGDSSARTCSSGLLYALGETDLRRDMISDARKYFQQSLEVAESVGDDWGEARALKALGDAYFHLDNYPEAKDSLIKARDIYSRIRDLPSFAQSAQSLGDMYYTRGEYSKAEESYIQTLDIYSQIGNQLGFAQSIKSLGDVHYMREKYSKAEEAYIQARDIYSQIGSQIGLAQSVSSLGDVYRMRSEYSKAEDLYIQTRDISSKIDDRLGFAQSVKSLGDVYGMWSEYSKAKDLYIQAQTIYSQIGDQADYAPVHSLPRTQGGGGPSRATTIKVGTADTIHGLAQLYKRSGDLATAETLYIQAKHIHTEAGNQLGIAESTCGLADIQRMKWKVDLARSSYQEAADLYIMLGNSLGTARAKYGLGDIYRQEGVHNKAEELYQEARSTAEELGHPLGVANALYGLGYVHCSQHKYVEAASCFQEAEEINGRIGNQLGVAEINCGMGHLYRIQGKHTNAETAYNKARELYGVVGHRLGAADAICGLAHGLRIQGRDVEAETLFKRAKEIYEEREYGFGVANAILGLAAVYLERLEYDDAVSATKKALEFYTQAPIPSLKATAQMMLTLADELQE